MILAAASFAICALLGLGLLLRPQTWLGRDDPAGLDRKLQARPIATVGLLVPTLVLVGLGRFDAISASCISVFALLGWADDRLRGGLAWSTKWAAQVLLLAAWFWFSREAAPTGEPFAQQLLLFGLAYSILTAWNIFDNFDGGIAWMGLASLASLWLLVADGTRMPTGLPVLLGGLLGFLLFNWPKARLYLGDAGSHATGFALVVLTFAIATDSGSLLPISGSSTATWAMLLVPHLVVLADLLQVVARRLRKGARPWIGDRRHLAHLIQALGVPRMLVAPALAGAQVLLTLTWIASRA